MCALSPASCTAPPVAQEGASAREGRTPSAPTAGGQGLDGAEGRPALSAFAEGPAAGPSCGLALKAGPSPPAELVTRLRLGLLRASSALGGPGATVRLAGQRR